MTWFMDFISTTPNVTQVIVSLAIMLSAGFLMTRLTRLIKLPNVTGYILAGILIGPYCLNLIPTDVIGGLDFISDIALAFIAFGIGEFFKFDKLKKNGIKVVVLTLFEALFASVLVFVVCYFVLGLSFVFAILLAALASATAPTATMMIIRQTKAKGEFVDNLLQVVALDNVISLITFSVALSISLYSIGADAATFNLGVIMLPILKNLATIAIGIVFGFLLKLFINSKHSSDNRLIIVICILFAFCAISSLLEVSPLLGCMAIGTIYANFSKDEKLFLQTNYFSPPFLLLFFVKSGCGFNFSALFASIGEVTTLPLIVVSLVYLLVRLVGKFSGSFVGSIVTKRPNTVKKYLGLGLIAQASVAVALASLGARTLGGAIGDALLTVVLASSIIYEFVGPVCAKLGLYLSKSYSTKIEDLIPDSELPNSEEQKTEVELLIERIQEIERQNKEKIPITQQEEDAFTEAGEETFEALYNDTWRQRNRRKRY